MSEAKLKIEFRTSNLFLLFLLKIATHWQVWHIQSRTFGFSMVLINTRLIFKGLIIKAKHKKKADDSYAGG